MSKLAARARILALLADNPGIHVGRLAALAGLSWNGTAHHLRHLGLEGLIGTLRVSNRRLYFLSSDESEAQAASVLTSAAARAIAQCVSAAPGGDVRAIASATGLSRRVVYHHAKRMRAMGALSAEGEPMRFHPTLRLLRLLRVS